MAAAASALTAFAIAVVLTPIVKRLARRAGLVAHPTRERWHRAPVPMLGGVAIVSAFVAATLLAPERATLAPLVAGCGAMFLLGLADDVWQLRPVTKLLGQIAIALALIWVAPPFRLTGVPFSTAWSR